MNQVKSTHHTIDFWFSEVCWACRPYGRKWNSK